MASERPRTGNRRPATTAAELGRVEGQPLPAWRLAQIWASLPERERLPFVLSLDDHLADLVIMLTAQEQSRG